MSEKEYIEREAAMDAILKQPPEAHYPEWYARDIREIQTADVVEVVHGKWIKRGNEKRCSCDIHHIRTNREDFCSYGERKEKG